MTFQNFFQFKKHGTDYKKEILAGITTFFTMSYIIFANPEIAYQAGMPFEGVFAATVICAAVPTIFMALFANCPFALAPGMGINTFITFTVCIGLGYHWKEGLALVFLTGIITLALHLTNFRKAIVKAIPLNLKYATSAGIGFLIVYLGLKNAGLLTFMISPGEYSITESGTVIGTSQTVPSLIGNFGAAQILAIFGVFLILALRSLEKRNNESYGAFLLGLLIITFIGIPLGVTGVQWESIFSLTSIMELKNIAVSFFGHPGLLSVFSGPIKATTSIVIILMLILTNSVDGISTIFSLGNISTSKVFSKEDYLNLQKKGVSSRIDKSLIVNSSGSLISSLFGTTTSTSYIESASGISAGGKTGFSALVTAIFFLLCLPLSSFFGMIHASSVSPVLIVAGLYLISLIRHINWADFEDAAPAAMVVAFIPLANDILNGACLGYISYIVIKLVAGKSKTIHPLLYITSFLFISIIFLRHFFNI